MREGRAQTHALRAPARVRQAVTVVVATLGVCGDFVSFSLCFLICGRIHCTMKIHFRKKGEHASLLSVCSYLGDICAGGAVGGACPVPGWAEGGSWPKRSVHSDHPHPSHEAEGDGSRGKGKWVPQAEAGRSVLPRFSSRSGGSGLPTGGDPDQPAPLQCTSMGRRPRRPVAGPCRPSGLGSTRPSLRRCVSPHQGGRVEGCTLQGWVPSSFPDLGGASLLWGTPQPRVSLPTAQAGRVGARLRPQLLCPQLGGHGHGGTEVPHCV